MASSQTYTGNGNTLSYSITFPLINTSDVKVSVAGTTQTSPSEYTITGTTVTMASAPANAAEVKIWRSTDISRLTHLYSAGSSITADSLNDNLRQLLYAIEESKNDTLATGSVTFSATPKAHILATSDTSWTIQDNVIDADMLVDNSITAQELANNSVGAGELANNSVDTAAIVDDSVTTVKILNDNVTYAKIQDIGTANRVLGRATTGEVQEVQVATDMIADDAVTYPKLQNLATANRVLGGTAAGVISEVQVGTDMIADGAVTQAKLGPSRLFGQYAILEDRRTHGVAGDNLTHDAWNVRTLNNEYFDTGNIVTLNNNQFTLGAGTYVVKWVSTFLRLDGIITRLRDVTNTATINVSINQFSQNGSGNYSSISSHGFARFTITGDTVYQLEYYAGNTDLGGTGGGGNQPADAEEEELYTILEIWREF